MMKQKWNKIQIHLPMCDDNTFDVDSDSDSDSDANEMDEDEKHYQIECCDIIISYMKYLIDVVTDIESYDLSYFIRIILFSLPMLSHKYSPNAITVNQILLVTHKWYKIKFTKNSKRTGIRNFSKDHELKFIQEIIAHLQSKVLATTYSNKNYAEIWRLQEEQEMDQDDDEEEEENGNMNEMDKDDDDEKHDEQEFDLEEEDDMIDID